MNRILSTTILLPALLVAALILVSCEKEYEHENALGPHPQGWMEAASAQFHGGPALERDGQSCRGCHGANLRGGDDGRSCYDCHGILHTEITTADATTHERLIADASWNLARCQRCHGTDYSGGTSGASCRECHTQIGGPAQCGTCHATPPANSDAGLPYGMEPPAAGAHAAHARFGCSECHPVPRGLSHADALPAELEFATGGLARRQGAQPTFQSVSPATSGNATCSNIYCHSNGRFGAIAWSGIMPEWTADGPLSCASCHGFPPPAPHAQEATCSNCHDNVDPTSDFDRPWPGSVRFLADSLHVNGALNL